MEANLTELAHSALRLYRDMLPVGSSLFADPELLRRFRSRLAEQGAGPHRAWEPVVAYLRAEQALGRVAGARPPPGPARGGRGGGAGRGVREGGRGAGGRD